MAIAIINSINAAAPAAWHFFSREYYLSLDKSKFDNTYTTYMPSFSFSRIIKYIKTCTMACIILFATKI